MPDTISRAPALLRLPWLVVAAVLVASVAELAFVPGFRSARNLLPLGLNLAWMAYFPAICAVGVGLYLQRRGDVLRRIAMWSPLVISVGVAGGSAARAGQLSWLMFVGALVGSVALPMLLTRLLPTLAKSPNVLFAPAAVVWVLTAHYFIGLSGDLMSSDTSLLTAVLPFVGAAGVLIQIVHGELVERSRLVVGLLFGIGGVVGLGLIIYLASWLPPLNNSLKLLAAQSVGLALMVAAEPLLPAGRARVGWLVANVAALVVAIASIGAVFVDIADRFGGLDRRYATAAGARFVSRFDDLDRDEFYDVEAGGNDCDDADPNRHPLAASPDRNCLDGGTVPRLESHPDEHRDVVLLIVDALRADEFDTAEELGRYPNLSRLASESKRFRSAYAPGNSTYMSLPALLSGLSPQLIVGSIVDEDPVPYGELMKGETVFDKVTEDRCTVMITATIRSPDWLLSLFPSDVDVRSFETTPDASGYSAHNVPGAVGRALDECGERPTLAVLYIDEPHKDLIAKHTCQDGSHGGVECYRQEIDAVDEAYAGFEAAYRERGRWSDTAVVFTSDHGESFGWRGHWGHSSNVYDEETHVPLWLRVPGAEPGDLSTPVTGLSIPPTLLALTGSKPEPTIYPSLLEVVAGRADPPPPVTTGAIGRAKQRWTTPNSAIRIGDDKLIYDWATTDVELYDLSNDPDEKNDLSAERPDRAARMRARLLELERALLLDR